MKYIKLLSLSLSLFSLIACNKRDSSISKGSDFDLPVETRSDPGCDICNGIIVSHCCCLVERTQSQTTDINLHICGVIGTYSTGESCTNMDTGDGCYDVNGQGIHVILTTNKPRYYFCIAPDSPFSLYNASGTGHGYVSVGCSSTGSPSGTVGVDLDYYSGGYARYFPTTGCQVDVPCDY